MSAEKMHAGEHDVDLPLVRRLVDEQFPQWTAFPLARVPSAGTDNAIYRLGDDMAVRLPRIDAAVGQVDKEHRWLPELAPYLPLAVPLPLARGRPAGGHPWHSSAGSSAGLLWKTDSPACDLITLAVTLPSSDRAEVRNETLKIVESLGS